MKASKPTSTALARVLALPLMAGLLAGCDYASKLPEAPSSLGYELQAQKPPSVTAPPGADLIGPPPPPSTDIAELSPPVPPPSLGKGLDTRALKVSPEGLEVPRGALELPSSSTLPPPASGEIGQTGFATLDATGRDPEGYTPPPPPQNDFASMSYDGPQLGVAAAPEPQFAEYAPVALDSEPLFADAPMSGGSEPLAIASLPAAPSYDQPSYDQPSYESTAYDTQSFESQTFESGSFETQPFEPQTSSVLYSADSQTIDTQPYTGGIGELTTVETTPFIDSQPFAAPPASPITVLHTRLDNGAVVSVHPVVGAPGATSMALSRAIASELGATVDGSELAFAPAVFDLRASASPDGGRPEAEWKLFSGTGALVGIFPESESGGTWTTMGDEAVRGMGRRVASRLRRNADLRRATLTSVASAPPITSIDYSAVLPSGAPSLAPMPTPRPAPRMAQLAPLQAAPLQPIAMAPLQPAPPQPAPVQQYVVNTAPLLAADPMANAVPRRRPEGTRTASLAPVQPSPQPAALPPLQPVAMAPLVPDTMAPPPPSFDTLRAATDTAGATGGDGPRALVFRGVRGAPGNGDQALGREVSRLLGQSGAQLAPSGTPNALYLTADVSRSRNGASDSIKIMWHVEEADGTRVGQVVQENDVPAGALDANWGEDAFYAAQGARDGIMELLRTSGAIGA